MILQRALWLIAAIAAIAAAAAVTIFALALALFALLKPLIGPVGAASAVALAAALLIGLCGLIAAAKVRGPRSRRYADQAEGRGLAGVVMDLIRAKPMVAAGIAAAAGLIAMRNPRVIAAVLRAFVEGWQTPPGQKR